jgi:hypothetical protein
MAIQRPTRSTAATTQAIAVVLLQATARPNQTTMAQATIAEIVSNQVFFQSPPLGFHVSSWRGRLPRMNRPTIAPMIAVDEPPCAQSAPKRPEAGLEGHRASSEVESRQEVSFSSSL